MFLALNAQKSTEVHSKFICFFKVFKSTQKNTEVHFKRVYDFSKYTKEHVNVFYDFFIHLSASLITYLDSRLERLPTRGIRILGPHCLEFTPSRYCRMSAFALDISTGWLSQPGVCGPAARLRRRRAVPVPAQRRFCLKAKTTALAYHSDMAVYHYGRISPGHITVRVTV
jgi:hypothetical protein